MQPLTSVVHFALASAVLLAPSTAAAQGDVPEGITATDWSSIRAAYDAGRHAAYPVEEGYRASNPGQRWTTTFDGRGFTTSPDAGGWTWGLDLQRYGFASQECAVERPIKVSAEGGSTHRRRFDW